MVVGPWWGRCCVGGQLEPLNLSDPRPNGEHCLIKSDQIRRDDASPDAEMWLNSTPQIGGFPKEWSSCLCNFCRVPYYRNSTLNVLYRAWVRLLSLKWKWWSRTKTKSQANEGECLWKRIKPSLPFACRRRHIIPSLLPLLVFNTGQPGMTTRMRRRGRMIINWGWLRWRWYWSRWWWCCHPHIQFLVYSPLLWDHFETALGQLSDYFEATLRQLLENFETTFGLLWENSETTFGQLRNDFGTTLRQLWDEFETPLKKSSELLWDSPYTKWWRLLSDYRRSS